MGGNDKSENDMMSERSAQLSNFSKRTGISNYSSSVLSKLSKPSVLPKESSVRDQAENRDLKNRLR